MHFVGSLLSRLYYLAFVHTWFPSTEAWAPAQNKAAFRLGARARCPRTILDGRYCEYTIFSSTRARIRVRCLYPSTRSRPCTRALNWTILGSLRWPNTVLARAFADANYHVHKDFKNQTSRQQSDHFIYSTPALSVSFYSIIACSVLMALVIYYNDMLQKVTMQRTQHF